MTADTPRCEPPPELRGVDGFFWLRHEDSRSDYIGHWRAFAGGYWSHGAGTWDPAINGWRYLAPAATPAEVDALRAEVMRASTECADAMAQVVALRAHVARMEEALEDLIDVQVLSTGWDNGVTDSTGTMNEGEYLHARAFDKARAALSAETP